MTVNELIEELKKYPSDMHVVFYFLDGELTDWISEPDILMRNISWNGKEYDEESTAENPGTRETYSRIKALTIEWQSKIRLKESCDV